jgi:hypothetical protein
MNKQKHISSIYRTLNVENSSAATQLNKSINKANHMPTVEKLVPQPYEEANKNRDNIINEYLNTFSEDDSKLKSAKNDYRKILVFEDGATFFSSRDLKAKLLEIPKLAMLYKCNSKERIEHFNNFLKAATKIYNKTKQFTNLFLRSGANVFTLQDILENELCLYVSYSPIFKGLHIIQSNNVVKQKVIQKRRQSNFNEKIYKSGVVKTESPKLIKSKSFCIKPEQYLSFEESSYYSENEKTKAKAEIKLHQFNNPKEKFIYFVEESIKLETNLNRLLKKEKGLKHKTKDTIPTHNKRLSIPRNSITKDLALYKASINEPSIIVKKNIKEIENKYIKHDKLIEEKLPLLIQHNIPKFEQQHNLSRSKLYDLYVQYKVLTKLSLASQDNEFEVLGIDCRTFFQGIPEMRVESEELVEKIFNRMNQNGTGILSWEEFLNTIKKVKSDLLVDKIDLFFDVII